MGPIDYNISVGSPVQAIMQAISFADQRKARKAQMDQSERRTTLAEQQEARVSKNADRNYGRGVLESDRAYDRGVAESDRGFGERERVRERGILESDRNFGFGEKKFDYAKERDGIMDGYRDEGLDRQDERLEMDERRLDMREQEHQAQQQVRRDERRKQKVLKEDMSAFASKPNKGIADYEQMISKHPEMASGLLKTYNALDQASQRDARKDAVQVYGALQGGSPDVAKSILERRVRVAAAEGDEAAKAGAEMMMQMIDNQPDAGKDAAGLFLAAAAGGSDLGYTLGALDNFGGTAFGPVGKIKAAGDKGRENGLNQSQINKVIVKNKNKSAEELDAAMDAEIKATAGAGGLKKAKAEPDHPYKKGDIADDGNGNSLIHDGEKWVKYEE